MFMGAAPVTRAPFAAALLGALLLTVPIAAAAPNRPAASAASAAAELTASPGPGTPTIRVAGDHLVNSDGQVVRLIGVDRSGTEYACSQGWGIFDGPSSRASLATIAAWGVNVVRVPLNEDCWLGINGVKPALAGDNYRRAIVRFVELIGAEHMVAILDLHWSAPGSQLATGQQVMADAAHSPAFWSSVAATFRADPGVIFDLYNEPQEISWSCWRNGCTVPAEGKAPAWRAAGMQSLVDAVRATGATQPVLLGGTGWSGNLTGWLAHVPSDPLHQEIADIHVYNFGSCTTASCWSGQIAPVKAKVPVVAAEVGQNTCNPAFATSFFGWADAHGLSYLAWTWDTWGCPEALITNYNGAATAWGAAFHTHLEKLNLAPLVPRGH